MREPAGAAVLTGHAGIATPVCVNLPGGTLEITVLRDFADAREGAS